MTKIRPPCLFWPPITNVESRQALAYDSPPDCRSARRASPKTCPVFSGRRFPANRRCSQQPKSDPRFLQVADYKNREEPCSKLVFKTHSRFALNPRFFRSARALTPHNVPRFLRDVSARAEAV